MKRAHCKVIISRVQCCTKRYFQETTLHGFRYITDPKSSKLKSFFWACICAISTCLCFILIRSQFVSYYSNRITTTIATTAFPIWEVPFPAVTICSFNTVYKDATEEIRELLGNAVSSSEIDNFFANLSSLVASKKVESNVKWNDHKKIVGILERKKITTDILMAKLAHPCNEMLYDCFWNTKPKNCGDIFTLEKTTSGYCCSFNYKGAKTHQLTNFNELYVNGIGPSFGLSVRLNAEENQYLSPISSSLGHDVSLHENIEYPDMSIYSSTIRPGNDVSLSVRPEITQSEKNVKGIDMKTRGCAFADEIQLDWSYNYSYATCINRCKAKAVKKLCECIPYYYYPVRGRSRYCTLLDMSCVKTNNSKIAYFHSFKHQASGDTLKCKCYPQCNEISYSYQLDQDPLKISETESKSNDSILRVYFGQISCIKLQRSVLITWELILASVGGLIGLCLGGSILSIIEFFYNILESIFCRYNTKTCREHYSPKLYITDFKRSKNNDKFS